MFPHRSTTDWQCDRNSWRCECSVRGRYVTLRMFQRNDGYAVTMEGEDSLLNVRLPYFTRGFADREEAVSFFNKVLKNPWPWLERG
ncbi:MAG: hypothetical protein ACR2J8_13200 [Thermomicrobiales bacterium]